MAYDDLRSFLRALEREGDLKRIKVEVDPHLEIGEIVDRVQKAKGPALLFENVKGSAMPLAMNVFGTERRLAKSLGLKSPEDIAEKISGLLKPELPHGFTGVRDAFGKLASMAHVPPRKVKPTEAPVQEVVLTGDEVDLEKLPALFTWPKDGGSFFNLGLTHTKDPDSGVRNLGLYRLQRHDKRTIGMHWQIHKDSRNHAAVAARRGERLPVAIAFGCPRWSPTPPPPRCPGTSTSTCSRASWPGSGSGWSTARPSRCRSRPTPRWCWRAGWSPTSCSRRARSATTPASTPRRSSSRRSPSTA